MSKILLIAEKPSQCRALVEALDKSAKKKNGYYESEKFIFSNVIGHFLELPYPEFRKDLNELPFTLEIDNKDVVSSYKVKSDKSKEYKVLKSLLTRNDIDEVVCATDPDAEGEAIYREIIESTNKVHLNQSRLIIKDTTIQGLRKQWDIRKSINEYEGLRQRAFARAVSDWLIGMNISQAVTLKSGITSNVGRVKTPLMKLVVDRYNENKNFKKIKSYVVEVSIGEVVLSNSKLKFDTEVHASEYIETIKFPVTVDINKKEKKSKQPSFYDLADIQKYGNKSFGLSVNKVLEIVQSLYDKGYVTYPRTDCKYITEETAESLNSIYGVSNGDNDELANKNIGEVSAHEGLTLTTKVLDLENARSKLSEDEFKIYKEIYMRFIANYNDVATSDELNVSIKVEETLFSNKYNRISQNGYLEVYNDNPFKNIISESEFEEINRISGKQFNKDEIQFEVKELESKPKPLFTEATLLSKMQNIHSDIENKELKELSKTIEGIGTPATRGGLIEELFKKDYFVIKGKSILPTEKCIELVSILEKVECPLVNVEYTARIEKSLSEVENTLNFDEYKANIDKLNKIMVKKITESSIIKKEKVSNELGLCPKCKDSQIIVVKGKYGDFFPCKDKKECDYKIPNFYKFTENDVSKLLNGKYTSTKTLKNKDNKQYKAKFRLNGEKLEREFVNEKKG